MTALSRPTAASRALEINPQLPFLHAEDFSIITPKLLVILIERISSD
jgi:hypothetical protein